MPVTTFFTSTPYFFLALILVYYFGFIMHWLPLSRTLTHSFCPRGIGASLVPRWNTQSFPPPRSCSYNSAGG